MRSWRRPRAMLPRRGAGMTGVRCSERPDAGSYMPDNHATCRVCNVPARLKRQRGGGVGMSLLHGGGSTEA